MFKKKKNAFCTTDHGKTDEKLLTFLGLKTQTEKKEQDPTCLHTENTVLKSLENNNFEVPRKFSKSDFKIGKKMGKGQFGEVMLVQHKLTGFLCGMKVMNKQ